MAHPRPLPPNHPTERIIGNGPAIHALRAHIQHLATFDAVGNPSVPTVLLQGETGTGKGLVARVLHDSGPRAPGPFLDVNCAAIPETLLEAELFGFEAGAFTDARRAKPGLFEAASEGTLFLDEIDALPLTLQAKLLTAIEAKRVRRVGAVREQPVDVKLIAATQTDLSARVSVGQFRADLYHRLAVVVLELPPLRNRGEDIVILAQQFLQQYAEAHRLPAKRLSRAAAGWLQRYDWPDNVRELSHLMERVTLLSPEAIIDPLTLERLCLPRSQPALKSGVSPAQEANSYVEESAHIHRALVQTKGNVAQAARLLGWSRKALRYRMRKYGVTSPRGAAKPSASPVRPLPAGTGQGEGTSTQPGAEDAVGPASGWEQKPVAVLAIEMTWPAAFERDALRYEPWTMSARWEQAIAEKVQGFGGLILQRGPSLLLAAFGLPHTLEQLPQRATQTALAIRQMASEGQAGQEREPRPMVRQAVHWGQVLVDVGASDPTARVLPIEEALAWPVRLLGQAALDEILLSSQVGRLVEGWFELQAHEGPLAVYSVAGLRSQRSPLAIYGTRPLSEFVGRARELAILEDLLGQVEGGRGQVVGIVGEPGVGKSRLLYEFQRQLGAGVKAGAAEPPVMYLEGHCLAYGSAIPYLPVLDLLQSGCGITSLDSTETITEKVRLGLQTTGMDPEEGAPYLLPLLGVETDTERLAELSPEVIRARTFATLRQVFLNRSQRQPLVIAVENLHWIDQTSEACFASLIEGVAAARILVLATYRPGYRPPWIEKSYATQMVIPPLSSQDSRQMLRSVLQMEDIPEPLAQIILGKAQGNPFFLEEIVQALVEQGLLGQVGAVGTPDRPSLATEIQIPSTVHGLLAARIDRLPAEEKALLQTLAVIGSTVPWRLTTAVVGQPEAALRQRLVALQAAEFLYEQPTWPEPAYSFKHVLTQEVAYTSVPREQRRMLHERAAQAIETLFEDRLEEHYGELAHHYRHSGNTQKSVEYLQRAGHQAMQRSAYAEAIGLLTTGLELLTTLPDTPERARQELDLLLLLGPSLMAIKGFTAPEVEQVYDRARALCEHVGDTAALSRVLQGLRAIANQRGEFQTDRELGEQLLSLAQRLQDPALLLAAQRALGSALFSLGELTLARMHFEQGFALYARQPQGSLAVLYGQDPGVSCLCYLGRILWLLGYPDQALQRIHEALTLAQRLANRQSVAEALCHMAHVHRLRREVPQTLQWAEAAITHATEQGFPVWLSIGVMLQGWALAIQSRGAQGMALMHEMLASVQATRRVQGQPSLLAWLAEGYLELGQAEEGLSMIAEALAVVDTAGERFYEAELYRLKGKLLLVRSAEHSTEAEACFHQALEVARHQSAKSLELRAAISLSRLWRQQGKRDEARQLLAEIYGWFTEGFDTADLQDAKALLEELS